MKAVWGREDYGHLYALVHTRLLQEEKDEAAAHIKVKAAREKYRAIPAWRRWMHTDPILGRALNTSEDVWVWRDAKYAASRIRRVLDRVSYAMTGRASQIILEHDELELLRGYR